ncbi:glycosyltransferase [Pseudomonas asiatica]|uniref:glycosyltransferase n=1 Tax=Pseudomonas asiatica TaxID=2219225 RepID=UPI002DB767AE|nr:glycosyltransferase [Pseudomonas asiatica]MEB6589942.1 glycosyltransferase [Pseudomonas asiatica]
MNYPLVTIAIPAFNPQFFRRTLGSAIAQDYPNLEILICDDSRDGEIEAACAELDKDGRVVLRYLRNPECLGFARNLLACLTYAKGEFIKFLCDDDTLLMSCISRQAQALIECTSASMVFNQRLLCDADDLLLPSRALNWVISHTSAEINGTDLLACIADTAINLFGGISHALLRRSQVQEYLPTLVQEGQGFAARLDMALYICLLRRGHLCSLEQVLSLERVHAGRLSHRVSTTEAAKVETEWLLQMLASSTAEPPPAVGWVRYRSLGPLGGECFWEELDLRSAFSQQMDDFKLQVGTNSLSFAQLYSEWLECRTLSPGQLSLLPKRIEQWPQQPRIVPVIVCEEGDEQALGVTLATLAAQSYTACRSLVLGPASLACSTEVHYRVQGAGVFNAWLAHTDADWLFLLRAGDRLSVHAMALMAERIALRPDSLCLYVDEGAHDGLLPADPVFKPDFNLDLMRSLPYVGRLLAFKCDAVRTLGGFDERFASLAPHDLLWRMVEGHGLHVVEHIAEVLVQSQYCYADWLRDPVGQVQASEVVRAHLQRLGVSAQVDRVRGSLVTRVQYLHEHTAGVSILIHAGHDLLRLRRCVESLFEHTRYDAYEVLLITNGEEPRDVRVWLDAMSRLGGQLRVIDVHAVTPAQGVNQASLQARGDYLLLLDTGCALFDDSWLQEMMNHAQRPEVGVVGPGLVNRDGLIAAGPLVLGLRGSVGNPFLMRAAHSHTGVNRLGLVQSWSALSLDCLLVRSGLFAELQGLDMLASPAAWCGADLCLRVRDKGYLVIWTPDAKVAQLAQGDAPVPPQADQEVFFQRWLSKVAKDPAYNPNLSLTQMSFNLEPGLRNGWDPFIEKAAPSVLALPRNTSGVGHYRVVQPFTELERAGYIQGRLNFKIPNLISLEKEKPDAIILQYRYSVEDIKALGKIKRFSQARRVFEVDDYVIEPPKKNDHVRNQMSNIRELLGQAIGLCDRLVVSTEPLADALSNFHSDIQVVPNMLAASLWTGLSSKRQTSVKPRVGWAGGTSHRGDLELMLGVVQALADEVDWVFFGMCPPMLRPYVREFHDAVSMTAYPQKLASLNLDLALAPLEQNLFNDCKSNLRLLEYGACGYPVVCTDTKAYGGYLPCTRVKDNSTEHWLQAIRMHLADPQASYRQGDELREAVLRDYVLTPRHLSHWANAWLTD